jgi:hypothetical protein
MPSVLVTGNENAQRNIGFKALRLVYSTPCNDAPVGRWDNLVYGTRNRFQFNNKLQKKAKTLCLPEIASAL